MKKLFACLVCTSAMAFSDCATQAQPKSEAKPTAQAVQAQSTQSQPYKSAPGPHEVQTLLTEWRDAGRNRIVPVKLYFAQNTTEAAPLIIFSHGLGGSREGAEYLGNRWASYGYVCLYVQHEGSDEAVWKAAKKGSGREALDRAANTSNAIARPHDVSFALDRMVMLDKEERWPLAGRVDFSRIGMSGHSFGAQTVLLVSGMKLIAPDGFELSLVEPRVRAAIALSPPAARSKRNLQQMYGSIGLPVLHMTGTRDEGLRDNYATRATERRLAFDNIPRDDQYLITFKDGDHMVFANREGNESVRNLQRDARIHDLILQSSLAFWDGYLREDASALAWLQNDFANVMEKAGKWEQKRQ